ncbi:MAG: hypothetical protein IKF90_07880 [Parasporobacterium sp.]|nr:hypothetical protein [Parasporobacterium sp.]
MTADYQLELTMSGTMDDLKKMLEVIRLYTGERPQSFSAIKCNGKAVDLNSITDELICELAANGKIKVTALGPWGRYGQLIDVKIFNEMAEEAPDASFNAEVSGNGQYEVQNLKCELKEKLLNITTYFEANDSAGEAWADVFEEKIPFDTFIELFQISGEESEDFYYGFIQDAESCCYSDFGDMDFDEFEALLEDYEADTSLEEDELVEIMEHKLMEYGVKCPSEYETEIECGVSTDYIYDPVAKSYIGENHPPIPFGSVENANDILSKGLAAQGLPSDKEAVENLSIDEAYEALFAGLGAGNEKEAPLDHDEEEE